jgi:glycosyltransferase involved in cell wall biosynthesis
MTAFFTFAYNAQDTIHRAVKSILNQTCKDWVYYLCDNGSKDFTRKIIEEYAKKDSRIIPIYIDVNNPYEASKIGFARIFSSDADYFCMLDADDEYKPDFLEKSIDFIEKNDLDACICGSEFIDAQTLSLNGIRQLDGNLILDHSTRYNELFPVYHQFFRTIWGKLYKLKLFKPFDFTNEEWDYYKVGYGGDTLFCMKALSYAERVGILAGSYHNYYMSHKSSSYQWNPKRMGSDTILLDDARNFLINKAGFVSPCNDEFLLAVYNDSLINTLNVLLNAKLDDAMRLDALCDMFLCDHTKQLAAQEQFGELLGDRQAAYDRYELFHAAADWLLSRSEVSDGQIEKYCVLGEFLCAAIENADGWIFFNKLRIEYLVQEGRFDEAKSKIDELLELLPEDEELLNFRERIN